MTLTPACLLLPLQVLLNKVALSSFAFQSATALLFFQCALAVALVQACKAAGLVQVEELRWGIVRIWLPVNLLFVAMIATSFWALQNLNVAMITGAQAWGQSMPQDIPAAGCISMRHAARAVVGMRYSLQTLITALLAVLAFMKGSWIKLLFRHPSSPQC